MGSSAGKPPRSGKEIHPHWTRTGRGGEYSPDGTREEKPERNEGTSGLSAYAASPQKEERGPLAKLARTGQRGRARDNEGKDRTEQRQKRNMQEKWRFFKKNRPLYAGIGIFREGKQRR